MKDEIFEGESLMNMVELHDFKLKLAKKWGIIDV